MSGGVRGTCLIHAVCPLTRQVRKYFVYAHKRAKFNFISTCCWFLSDCSWYANVDSHQCYSLQTRRAILKVLKINCGTRHTIIVRLCFTQDMKQLFHKSFLSQVYTPRFMNSSIPLILSLRQHCAKRKLSVFNLLRGRFWGFSPLIHLVLDFCLAVLIRYLTVFVKSTWLFCFM